MKVVAYECFECGKLYEQNLWKHGIFGSSDKIKQPMISHENKYTIKN